MTKQELQEKLVEQRHKKLILLEWCTSLGKSFAAIRLAKEFNSKKILLLVSEEQHKRNWVEEINKYKSLYGYDLLSGAVTIICYASLKNYTDTEWDLLVADECHHISEARQEYLSTIKIEKVIGLSATLEPIQVENFIKVIFGDNSNSYYHSKITLKEAIKAKIIPEPDIYLIPLELNNTLLTETITESWGSVSKRIPITCTYKDMWAYKKNKLKYPNVTLTIRCAQSQKDEYYNNIIDYYKNRFMRNYQEADKQRWLRYGNLRKLYLGNIKTKDTLKLISKLQGKRFICFCSNIEQAELLGNDKAIHSKNTSKTNSKILSKFQNKDINDLYCVGMLTEGQNLKDIDAGIIVQLDGKERPFIQKSGRILRSENPIQFIFYFKGTKDEEYLNNILEGINKEYIQVIDNLETFYL